VQRLLWGSTGTKNPNYSDVLYVEHLIGRDTVNTVPPETLDAFRDHGVARVTVGTELEQAEADMARLREFGIDLAPVFDELQRDGLASFALSYDRLLGKLHEKRHQFAPMGARR
jgi:transaldolase/transaldolase/glucose-6-phosphate isomerase